jgi:chaperone protein EcpD
MKPFDHIKAALAVCTACLLAPLAQANVVVTGTRVIYPASAREVTVKLDNTGNKPTLLQAWIDDGNTSVEARQQAMPFVLTPPVSRIDPGKGQMLRMTYTHEPLPADRESVYWLNLLDIPPKPSASETEGKNLLQVAIRTRIKIFYRPGTLQGDANAAPEQLTWQLTPLADGTVAAVTRNPTPYHVNLTQASVEVNGKTYRSQPGMTPPFGQHEYVLEGLTTLASGEPPRIRFNAVNDYGANVHFAYPPEDRR